MAMKRFLLTTMVIGLLMFTAVPASAAVYSFNPSPPDMYGLSHPWAYTWGIDWTSPDPIVSAQLRFENIWDGIVEDDDMLFIRLLDDAPLGVTAYEDGLTAPDDYFAGQGTLIGTWTDPAGGGPGIDLVFEFTAAQVDALNAYAGDGRFALGLDGDCHYFNDGITLSVVTAVPEPTTMLLFGLGLLGFGVHRKLRK
jgi:hypothetical protein